MKNRLFASVCVLAFVTASAVHAGSDTMSVPSDTIASVGGSFSVTTVLDAGSGDVQGFSYGLCHTASLATIDSVDDADTATVKNGSPADFNEKSTFVDGFTQGVVICFTGCAVIPAGTTGFQMATGNYTSTNEGAGTVGFCDTLGSPPTATVVVVGGASITPVQNNGSLSVVGVPDPEFTYSAGTASANYPAGAGIGGLALNAGFSIAEVDNSAAGGIFPNDTQGFSMGFANDENVATPVAVNVTLPFTADFAETNTFPNGWTAGVVYSFTGGVVLQFDSAIEVANVDYEGVAGALTGVEGTTSSPLTMDSGLGSPPVSNVVVVGGGSLPANGVDGALEFTGTTVNPYISGDCNGDTIVNIADIVWSLSELFGGGPSANCEIACDSNGDDLYDAGDPIYTANYVFLAGPAPTGPASCDTSAGQTAGDCVSDNCGGSSAPLTFVSDIQPILTASCMPCHAPGGAQGNGPSFGLQLTENAFNNIVGVGAGQCGTMDLVTPGDRQMSWLYRKIQGSHLDQDVLDLGCCADDDGDGTPDGCGRQMPRFCETSGSCLDEATIELIGSWIDAGAQ